MRATVNQGVSECSDDLKLGRRPTAKDELALPNLGAQGDVLLRNTGGLLRGHLDCDPVVWDLRVDVLAKCPVGARFSEF